MQFIPKDCVARLEGIANEQSFYTPLVRRPIRITFTSFRAEKIEGDRSVFKLNARCSSYRDIGVLYIQIKGEHGIKDRDMNVGCQLGLGFPDSAIEKVLAVGGNLVVLLTGIVLIRSAAEFSGLERVVRYSFLPFIYAVYGLRLSSMFRRVREALPEIILNWCKNQDGLVNSDES